MTLLNTISNIGTKWPQTFALWLVDILSWKRCIFDENFSSNFTSFNSTNFPIFDNKCENKSTKDLCIKAGGKCHIDIDGYYIEGAFSVIYGIIFYFIAKKCVNYLEELPLDDWHILSKKINESGTQAESERLREEEK